MQSILSNEIGENTTWDYKSVDTKYNNHGIHEYPARMIPQIANRLIETYGKDKKIILDPFTGSGTTLLESKLCQNFETAYGIDINPLARLIAKVKTTPINPELLKEEYELLIIKVQSYKNRDIEKPDFFNIDFWFKDYVIISLCKFKKAINEIENKDIQDFFKVVFSFIIRKVSNTRNNEFKLYKMSEKSLKTFNPDVFEEFKNTFNHNYNKMKEFYKTYNKCNVKILNEDSRLETSIPSNVVDLIVTSPPYGDSITTVAYGQFSRLSLQWLDFDRKIISSIDKNSLGGKPKGQDFTIVLKSKTLKEIDSKIRVQDEGRANDVLAFFNDFYLCIEEFDRIVKNKGVMCFVVGNRTVKKVPILTDKIIVELFKIKDERYKHLETMIRNIPSKKMPKANSPTNKKGEKVKTMNHEYIVIIEKY